jgi:ligand-binding sensor domain-containing protein
VKSILIYFLLICFGFQSQAQQRPGLKFSNLTEMDGLSNNIVRSVTQDAQGFIWFATDNGLNRFDGYRIRKFYHHPADTFSLVNNQLVQLEADRKNNLWISTVDGLSFFDRKKNAFINFKNQPDNPASLKIDHNNALFTDEDNNEWITAPAGFYRFDEQLHFLYVPMDSSSHFEKMIPEQLSGLYADAQKTYWTYAGTYIFRLNDQKGIAEKFNTSSGFLISFCQDIFKHYWVGTFAHGMYAFDDSKHQFSKISAVPESATVNSIVPWKDLNNYYWLAVGTDVGLFLFDPITHTAYPYRHQDQDDFSLSGNVVNKVFVDKQNILWLATNNGVSYVEPSKQIIETWALPSVQENGQSDNPVVLYSAFETDDYYLFAKWNKTGYFQFDKSGKLIKDEPDPFPGMLNNSKQRITNVFCITKDAWKNTWYTTNDGLVECLSGQDHYTVFHPRDCDVQCGFRNIAVLDDTTWFIRTRNNGSNGIYRFNPQRKVFSHHWASERQCGNCLPDRLTDLVVTHKGEVFTTPLYKGLYQLDSATGQFLPVRIPGKSAAIGNTFDCLKEDKAGNLWIGTVTGLFAYNPGTRRILADFTSDTQLGGIAILKLCFDDHGNIWMNTKRGLYCLIMNGHRVLHFGIHDGLPSNLMDGFLEKTKDGSLICGTNGYVIRFVPDELLKGGAVNINTCFSEASSGDKDLSFTWGSQNKKRLELPAGGNILSVDFAVLNFDNAAGNRYYYKLDGAMSDWKENENGHLSFYNLPPGNYDLHVQGGNKYGTRFAGGDLLTIVVQPKWWQTLLFKCAAATLLLVLLITIMFRRIRNIRHAAELKQRITEAEMMALRAQMNPHFIFNCMNSIDGLITSNRNAEAQEFLQKFSKLIRLVLENSQYQLVPLQTDLKALELYTSLEMIRSNHRFTYSYIVDPELSDGDYKIPPLLLQPYVENAILHGLRNKASGAGLLSMHIRKEGENIRIIIEDNGVGRARAGQLNEENRKPHQQMGMKVTARRLSLLQLMNNQKWEIHTEDICDDAETGTRVTIVIPAIRRFE